MNQSASYGAVPFAELLKDSLRCLAVSGLGMRGSVDQFIGHATHGRNHHHQITLAGRVANNLHHFADARRIADTGPAKLHDSQRSVYIRHNGIYLLPNSVPTAGL